MQSVAGHQQDPGVGTPPNKAYWKCDGRAPRIRSSVRAADRRLQTLCFDSCALLKARPLADYALITADDEPAGQSVLSPSWWNQRVAVAAVESTRFTRLSVFR